MNQFYCELVLEGANLAYSTNHLEQNPLWVFAAALLIYILWSNRKWR